MPLLCRTLCLFLVLSLASSANAQTAPDAQGKVIAEKLQQLQTQIEAIKAKDPDPFLLADVQVFAKAAEWALRHHEFYTPQYADHAIKGLDTGLARAALLLKGEFPWDQQAGSIIRGYLSNVDGSTQPYCVKLPPSFVGKEYDRWPLQINLHGRGDKLNEVNFIAQHDGKPVKDEQNWIQLEVFGRTNNGYRWAGETDVLEAFKAVQRRYRIDNKKVVLRGFSMGGAGSWHLGLHFPSLWCSVGPGAGFVDFYKYQKVETALPRYQDATLKIYDSVNYVRNAANVPIMTYGGELDEQLVASTSMVAAAKALDVEIKIVIGPDVGHKFHPESEKEFMAYHQARMEQGRAGYPGLKKIRFETYTPKYNTCEWVSVEEQLLPYEQTLIDGHLDENNLLHLTTKNVAVLKIARDVADEVEIDGEKHPITRAADGLLPYVYYQSVGEGWSVLSYDASLGFNKNLDFRKRKDLQGPIDDAFMQPFVCVIGTGKPWNPEQHAWAAWTLDRFAMEFDKWMRGKIQIIKDTEVTDELMSQKHLILFGDPGSNSIISKIHKRLPFTWSEQSLTVMGQSYDSKEHGMALIYPNPLAPRKYVVINSGHTFHEPQFKASNAQLYPRLGDIAVVKYSQSESGYSENTVWADIFNSSWRLPKRD